MGELINGRTPEEIKRGLRWIAHDCDDNGEDCNECECVEECHKLVEDDVARDAIAYIERLEAAQLKWIGVKERMPEDCVSVLVWAVYHNEDGWDWSMLEIDNYCDPVGWDNTVDPEAREVTHWMPLPESPKED